MSKPAAFLDRDGTLIEDTGFVRHVTDVKLLPTAAEAVRRLNEAGWVVIVVSNQSGVARGLLTEDDVAATNKRMMELLKKERAHVDAVYYCPHLPEGKVSEYAMVCDCRKPRPGMLLRAAEEHDIDLANSVTIGDAPRDVEAGLAAGTRAVLLTESPTRADQAPDACGMAVDLLSAVADILESPSGAAAGDSTDAAVKRSSRRRSQDEKEKAVSDKKKPIPIHRAPKEFVPEQDEPVEEEQPPSQRASEPAAATEENEEDLADESPLRCGRCGREISLSDVKAGRAYDKDDVRLCRDCVVILRAQKIRPKDVSNEDLHRELQNITRALTYERFSYWHVFGAIVQALAIGSLIVTYFKDATPEGLLWAIFFQLLALTFFVLGRQ